LIIRSGLDPGNEFVEQALAIGFAYLLFQDFSRQLYGQSGGLFPQLPLSAKQFLIGGFEGVGLNSLRRLSRFLQNSPALFFGTLLRGGPNLVELCFEIGQLRLNLGLARFRGTQQICGFFEVALDLVSATDEISLDRFARHQKENDRQENKVADLVKEARYGVHSTAARRQGDSGSE
jgi:hypothetical protein